MTDFTIPRCFAMPWTRAGRRPALLWVTALALTFSVTLPAAETDGSTWVRYFPDRPAAPANEAGWAELAKVFPNRVKPALPAAAATLKPPPAASSRPRLA